MKHKENQLFLSHYFKKSLTFKLINITLISSLLLLTKLGNIMECVATQLQPVYKQQSNQQVENYDSAESYNDITKMPIPFAEVYPYVSAQLGMADAKTVEHYKETLRNNYKKFTIRDFRLNEIQDKIVNMFFNTVKDEEDVLNAVLQAIDFSFRDCLNNPQLNRENQFKYTARERFNIYKNLRLKTLQKADITK